MHWMIVTGFRPKRSMAPRRRNGCLGFFRVNGQFPRMECRPLTTRSIGTAIQRIAGERMPKEGKTSTDLMAMAGANQLHLHQVVAVYAASLHLPMTSAIRPCVGSLSHTHLGGSLVATLKVQPKPTLFGKPSRCESEVHLSNTGTGL